MVKNSEKEAQEKKNQDIMLKQLRAKQQIEEKALREEEARLQHEAMI